MPPYIRPERPSAEWMPPQELRTAKFNFNDGCILIGKTKDGRQIGLKDNRHLVTIAGSRAGKSATSLMTNLLTWKGSTIVIDPKGELATNTARRRAEMGQDVYILDPFGEVKEEQAAQYRADYNPLDELHETSPDDVIDDAAMIAEALIVAESGKQDHWTMSAKNLLRGLILYALSNKGDEASFNFVRYLLTLPMGDDKQAEDPDNETVWLSTFFKLMANNEDFDGVIAGIGGTMSGKPATERGSIISTAVEQTSFLDSSPMKDHLEGGELKTLRVLKRKPTSIYLVLPASRMATHFRWLRMILMQAMAAMEREENQNKHDVLFILEEFPTLGYMRQIEAAAGLMAGYGVKLWTIMQDLSQIKALYPNSWETFLGNAGIVEAFGNTDSTTLEYISKRLGDTLAVQVQPNDLSLDAQRGGAKDERETVVSVPLMPPHEIAQAFARDKQNKLVMIAGEKPFVIRRIFWKDAAKMVFANLSAAEQSPSHSPANYDDLARLYPQKF